MTRPDIDSSDIVSTTLITTTTVISGHGDNNVHVPHKNSGSVTNTVAAITVAVLSCVFLLTLILIFRALRKRRQAQRGQQLDRIPTISTGVMGTGVAAYQNSSTPHAEGPITWEPVTLPEGEVPRPGTSRS